MNHFLEMKLAQCPWKDLKIQQCISILRYFEGVAHNVNTIECLHPKMFGMTLVQLFWKRLFVPLSLNIYICYFGTCITVYTFRKEHNPSFEQS